MKKLLIALSAFAAVSLTLASEKFDLWPEGKMPGKSAAEPESSKIEDTWIGKKDKVLIIRNVSKPTLEFFKAKSDKPTGLVVVCPGGGYGVIAYGHEGTEIAEWLNSQGVSALVLKYRVPNNPMGALMDAQRAIRTARANAKEWNVDPNKIAVMGFSAGASLSARASTNYAKKLYEPIDNIDGLSARPDGTILIYPAYCDEPATKSAGKTLRTPARLQRNVQARRRIARHKGHPSGIHRANARRRPRQLRNILFPRSKGTESPSECPYIPKRRARLCPPQTRQAR